MDCYHGIKKSWEVNELIQPIITYLNLSFLDLILMYLFSMRRFGYRSARNLLLTLANFDPTRYVASRLEVFLAHTPSGTSFRNMIHFAQNVGSSVIRKLDYGYVFKIKGRVLSSWQDFRAEDSTLN